MLQLWKEAATALLFKRNSESWKILMLERSSKSSFMPGMRVFPGGIAAKVDFSPKWLDMLVSASHRKNASNDFGITVNQLNDDRPLMIKKALIKENFQPSISANVGFRICAIRETFEESGILLYKPLPGRNSDLTATCLKEWRNLVNENENEFLNMCLQLNVVPDIWNMYEWSNWLTPLHMGGKKRLRYDTMFYAGFLSEDSEAMHDSGEIVSAEVLLDDSYWFKRF